MRHRVLFALSVTFAATLAGGAAARAPAYTMRAGFHTALENVPDADRWEECLDLACHEKGGTLVAQGSATHDGVALTVRIREYRHHANQSQEQLEAIAEKLVTRGVDDRELRLVAGKVQDRPAVEQWSIVDPCEHELGGRVLLSLSDKVVEVEATAKAKADGSDVAAAVSVISSVLHGARVRRTGDVTLDPATDTPPPHEIADALSRACP